MGPEREENGGHIINKESRLQRSGFSTNLAALHIVFGIVDSIQSSLCQKTGRNGNVAQNSAPAVGASSRRDWSVQESIPGRGGNTALQAALPDYKLLGGPATYNSMHTHCQVNKRKCRSKSQTSKARR